MALTRSRWGAVFSKYPIAPCCKASAMNASSRTSERIKTCVLADIEQPLTGRNLIKPADLFPKQAKDFNLHCIEAFNQVMDLALHGHAHPMTPFEQLENPTQGWPFCRLVDLVRQRLVLTRQVVA